MNRIYQFYWLLGVVILLFGSQSFAQVRFGPKVGIHAYAPMYSDAILSDSISVIPQVGFSAGIAMDYKINDRFSFYTDIAYSRKGKKLKGGIEDEFRHDAVYHYLELPVMLRVNFKGSTNRGDFGWYLSGGGILSYWMSGKGTLKSFELIEIAIPDIKYDISFTPVEQSSNDGGNKLHLNEPNRVQAGLTFETGISLNFRRKQHLLIGLRYTYRQSWLGKDFDVDVGLAEYKEDFRTLEHILAISSAWFFEWNIGQGKKGKSTVKKRPKS